MKSVTGRLLNSVVLFILSGGFSVLNSQTMERWQFQEFTSEEIRQQARERKIVVIPVAQIENHGLSLPVGTVQFLATEICERAVQKSRNAIVGPAITLGNCSDFSAWPGYVVVSNMTFLGVVGDYLTSLSQQGFWKAVFFLMHGGHNFNTLDIAVSEINRKLRMKVHIVSIDLLFRTLHDEVVSLTDIGIDPEFAMMVALRPELVKAEGGTGSIAAVPTPSLMSIGRYYDPAHTLDKIAPEGFISYSEKATLEVGEMLLERSSSILSAEILNKLMKD